MRRLMVVVVVALLLPCMAMAQYGMDMDDETRQLRVRAGWFDMGDADDGFGVGADYLFEAFEQEWMFGVEWGDIDPEPTSQACSAQLNGALPDTYWGVTLNWIGRTTQDDRMYEEDTTQFYYGGGIGWYRLDDGTDDDSFGVQALVGADFAEDWFADLRYVFGTDLFEDADVDGIRATVGYRF